VRVQQGSKRLEFVELATVFFVQWMAMAAWMVPLTLILLAHGLEVIQPYAFATTALAAFVSPLIFGALADRQVAPTRVLRWLSIGAGVAMAVVGRGISLGWDPWLVLVLIQVFALCVSPTVSISSTIAFSRMVEPRRQFGPIRAMGTIGWMVGCWIISLMGADESTLACYFGAALWLGLAAFTYLLPKVDPPRSAHRLTVRQRLGLDALSILRNSDHRVVFITATLFTIPLAAFYPLTPPHLQDLGLTHASAWMSLGQTTEIIAMFSLGALLMRWRLKWILGIGLSLGVVRFLFCALDTKTALLIGVTLHGCTYTLFFTTAQIYVNERVDATWRARAQALLTLMLAGVGHFVGYLSTGWWYRVNTAAEGTRWPVFWGGLAAAIGAVLIYFLVVYRGRGSGGKPASSEQGI
jgi:nucleoside transporter